MSDSVKLNIQRVSDVIKDDYKMWKEGDLVTLQFQTGAGKSYFIFNSIIPNMKPTQKMLILTNRRYLTRQFKLDLCKKLRIEISSEEELNDMNYFGNITLMSYQSLNERLLDVQYGYREPFNLDRYDYIIADEVQYIVSDAFTNKTYLTIDEIIKKRYDKAIRIFISANMTDWEESLKKAFNEQNENNTKTYRNYNGNRDYLYLEPYYFMNIDVIIDKVINDKSDDKWLIFVSSLKDGEKINSQLKANKVSSEFINSSNNGKKGQDIVMTNQFSSKVLIATTVLDNGVNIIDEKVKHLVCITYELNTFLQEVGRIRFKDLNNVNKINIYLKKSYLNTWILKLSDCNRILKLYKLLLEDENKFRREFNNCTGKLQNGFYLDGDNKWRYCQEYIYYMYRYKVFIENEIKGKYEYYKEYTYIRAQLKLLGLDVKIDLKRDLDFIKEKEDKNMRDCKLELYLNELVGKELFAKEKKELIHEINLKDSRGRLQKSIGTLDNYLKDNFEITLNSKRIRIEGKQITIWMLTKLN